MELPRYKLQYEHERAALQRLRPALGGMKNHRDFQKLVLAYLALIGENYSKSDRAKPERTVLKLRRHASKIIKFVHWLRSSKPKGLIGGPPSTDELLRYAESLSSLGDFRALQARTRQLRHSTHKETHLILHLLQFVREQTGKPHWAEMAMLLMGACNDRGMNERRLQALWYRQQKRSFRRRAALSSVVPSHSVGP